MSILTVGQLVINSKRDYMRSNDLSNTNIFMHHCKTFVVKHFAEIFQRSNFYRMVKKSDQKHFESKVGGTKQTGR